MVALDFLSWVNLTHILNFWWNQQGTKYPADCLLLTIAAAELDWCFHWSHWEQLVLNSFCCSSPSLCLLSSIAAKCRTSFLKHLDVCIFFGTKTVPFSAPLTVFSFIIHSVWHATSKVWWAKLPVNEASLHWLPPREMVSLTDPLQFYFTLKQKALLCLSFKNAEEKWSLCKRYHMAWPIEELGY